MIDLQEFSKQVRERTLAVNAAKGKEAEELNIALSAYIAENMQVLLKQGVSINKIQDALRAAVDDLVPQTYAPDADENDEYIDLSEEFISETIWFLPVNEEKITAFFNGKISENEWEKFIRESPDATAFEDLSDLDLVLSDTDESSEWEEIFGGGEMLVDSNGEAFVLEKLNVVSNGNKSVICDPMVFKTAEEVRKNRTLMESLTEEAFREKINNSADFDEYDTDAVFDIFWNEFVRLRKVYTSVKPEDGLLIYATYNKQPIEE